MYRHAKWGGLVLSHVEVVDLRDSWMTCGPDGQRRIILDIYRKTEVMMTNENIAGLFDLNNAVNAVLAADDDFVTLNPLYVMWLKTRNWQTELLPGFWADVLTGPIALIKPLAQPRDAELALVEVGAMHG